MAARVKVSKKNQISIPSEVRKQLGIKPGDTVIFDLRKDHALVMRDPDDWVTYWEGRFKDVWAGVDAVEYVRRERGVCMCTECTCNE